MAASRRKASAARSPTAGGHALGRDVGTFQHRRAARARAQLRAPGPGADIEIASGEVKARVQGSERQPYQVSIKLKPLSAADWQN
ncbi:MAG: hypothetical protein IPK63_16310 [Candidatus Competibacteraceae bacterium]|nr:hypothetical protein [Candidatus Competibacteraceae bacterium]